MIYSVNLWERGGPDGDDKFEVGTAYGRFRTNQDEYAWVFRVETFIHANNGTGAPAQITNDGIRKAMPWLPICASFDKESLELTVRKQDVILYTAKDVLQPRNDHQLELCERADALYIILQKGFYANEFWAYLPNYAEPFQFFGTSNVYEFIANLPITVDVARFISRCNASLGIIRANTRQEQIQHENELATHRELDHLIYDGLRTIDPETGRMIGSIRS